MNDLDIAPWKSLFPLQQTPLPPRYEIHICGPQDIAILEQIREHFRMPNKRDAVHPCDVFVFSLGESPERTATKVGGLPYRPRAKPWPISAAGKVMTFLAQFNFSQSRDIVGNIPGDVMLVFAEDDDITEGYPDPKLRFEWYPLGLQEMIPADEVPSPSFKFITCWGHRHRTCDVERVVDEARFKVLRPGQHWGPLISRQLSVIPGMKIGGLPFFVNKERMPKPRHGRFICSLASIWPRNGPYPWVNCPQDLYSDVDSWLIDDAAKLEQRDGFLAHFLLKRTGDVIFRLDFY